VRVTRDPAAFAECYRSELDGLVRLAFAVSGDGATAEEVVAEAVVRVWTVWRKDGRTDEIDDLGAYLRRAVVNEVIGRGRRRGRWERRRTLMPVGVATRIEPGADDRHVLWEALRTLPLEQRAVIALRFLTDLSEAQTGDALGIPIGTVKSRVSRGLAALRVELSEVAHDA
jgi:RNA polymerase sigma-70 factor (sigma-E family)